MRKHSIKRTKMKTQKKKGNKIKDLPAGKKAKVVKGGWTWVVGGAPKTGPAFLNPQPLPP
jgi:hypothetical protein